MGCTFLTVCNHEKITIQADNYISARDQHPCRKCNYISLKDSKRITKDVRVFPFEGSLHAKVMPIMRQPKGLAVEQMDWVNQVASRQ